MQQLCGPLVLSFFSVLGWYFNMLTNVILQISCCAETLLAARRSHPFAASGKGMAWEEQQKVTEIFDVSETLKESSEFKEDIKGSKERISAGFLENKGPFALQNMQIYRYSYCTPCIASKKSDGRNNPLCCVRFRCRGGFSQVCLGEVMAHQRRCGFRADLGREGLRVL